jgi:hypothetical protein
MAIGKKTGGRRKGVPNKLTSGAKEVIAQVAVNIGGVARMTKWVRESKENERAFWTNIYTKLLPLQVAGDKDNPLSVINRIERHIVDNPTRCIESNERDIGQEERPVPTPHRHWAA